MNPFVPKPDQDRGVIDAYTPRGIPQSFLDFFQSNVESRKPSGRFTTKGPGATLKDAEGLLADASGAILSDENLGDAEFDFRDSIQRIKTRRKSFS